MLFRDSTSEHSAIRGNKGFIRPTVAIPLLIIFCFLFLSVKNFSIIDETIETLFVDYRFKIRNYFAPPEPPQNVVIVAIDEKSLADYGRWPWSRTIQAELIDKIFEQEPKAVAVDIFYPEPESSEADSALADVIEKQRDRLVMALGFLVKGNIRFEGEIPDVLYDNAIVNIKNFKYLDERSIDMFNVLLPPEPIASASRFGHVYALPDLDGKLRYDYMYVRFGDEYFPSLALQTALIAEHTSLQDLKVLGGEGIQIGDKFIPSDEFGRLHVNYYGKERTIRHISAADILSGQLPLDTLRNRVVFIGTTATATYDQKSTPFSANYPGVEKNATIVANILDENYLLPTPIHINMLVVLFAGLLALLIGQRKINSLSLLAMYFFLTAAYLVINQALFTYYGTRLNLIYPLLTIFSEGTFIVNYRYFVEERKARDVRKMFSSYVTERVVNELIKNPEMAKLGGDRREVTIFFSDIRSFTTFSEKHEPEEVVAMLNEYLNAMTDIVFKWEGTLDKFIGDAIVAFWGAPLAQENHPELAIRCSLNMIDKLMELQDKWRSEGKTPLDIGIGINTGEVLVGNIGAEGKKMDYTVIGDHVNLAARVESLTKKYSARILITEFTLEKIRDIIESNSIGHISVEGLERVIVKGKEEPVGLYKVTILNSDTLSVITDPDKDKVVKLTEK